MRFKVLYLALASSIIFSACSTSKLTTTAKTNATSLESSGKLTEALEAWDTYFSQTSVENVDGADFSHAAQTAYKAGNSAQAVSWFDQARYKNFADPEMYITLANIYNSDDNLSKELSALETFTDKFGTDNETVNQKLFSIYGEIGENEKALKFWNLMNKSDCSEKSNLLNYFQINKKMENASVCDSVAGVLLQLDSEQSDALDWLAKKYYHSGQDRYEREMKKYEQDKTRKQYNILLKELDLVTADFKKALPYLEKLWKQNQNNEYASYFVNIYARFGDEGKVNYYKKYLD